MKKILRFLLTTTISSTIIQFILKISWKQAFIYAAVADITPRVCRKIHEINEHYTSDESDENNENNY